ncbi:MAG: TonB-dependent receptor plug domain-containing protein [Pseudobdellovibrionaceae bacterium]
MRSHGLLLLFIFFASPSGYAAEELPPLIVEGNLPVQNKKLERIIDADSLDHADQGIGSLLTEKAIPVFRSGGRGGLSTLFFQGLSTGTVQIFVDGIAFEDPTHPQGATDLNWLEGLPIKTIQVLGLRESFLLTGSLFSRVLWIETEAEARGLLQVSEGSNNFLGGKFYKNSNLSPQFSAKVFLNHEKSDEFSSAVGGKEADSFKQSSALVRTDYQDETSMASLSLRGSADEVELDRGGGASSDDPNAEMNSSFLGGTFSYQKDWNETQSTEVQWMQNQVLRNEENKQDPMSTEVSKSDFRGLISSLKGIQKMKMPGQSEVAFSLEARESQVRFERSYLGIKSYFPLRRETAYKIGGAWTETWIHSETRQFKTHFLLGKTKSQSRVSEDYGFETQYILNSTFLYLRLGQGQKNPSLIQVYDPQYGNLNLKPEKILLTQIGISKNFETSSLRGEFFDHQIRDLITIDSSLKNKNLNSARLQGVEGELKFDFEKGVSVQSNLQFLGSKDGVTKKPLIRRPDYVASFGVKKKWIQNSIETTVTEIGPRPDYHPITYARIQMPKTTTVNVSAHQNWSERFSTTETVENLLDLEYQAVSGFSSPRRTFLASLNFLF